MNIAALSVGKKRSHGVLNYLTVFLLAVFMCGAARGATSPAWTQKAVAGHIAYFAFATPARIERYDMNAEQWLTSIPLTASPTALAVDGNAIVIAYNRAVVTRALDGTGETGLINMPNDVQGLLLAPDFIFVMCPTYSSPSITSIRRSDRQFVATWSGIYSFGTGFAIAPTARRLYGINSMTSGGDLDELDFNADGSFPTGYPGYRSAGSYYYTSSGYPRTYVSPDEKTLILGAGYVFDAESLTYRASLAGNFDDMGFYGNDVPVLLRGDTLYAYSNSFLESGTKKLAAAAQAIALNSDDVFVFSGDATKASGIAVEKVAISSFSTAQPGAAIDPAQLNFVPDDVISAGDGTFFVFSKTYQSIFRWSATTRTYTASYPLLGAALYAAYSPTFNRLYTAYASGRINQIKLDANETTEVPFANLPTGARGLAAAGNFIFATDASGAWGTHYTFGSDGTQKASRDWNYYSREYIWSPVQQRMYFFRDDTSPNDILYEAIDATGQLSAPIDSPYHGTYSFVHPIRLSTDETGVLIGSGVVFATSNLTYAGSLANTFTDAVSRNNRWVTIRNAGTASQIQTWTQNLLFEAGFTVPGYAFRLFNLPDGKVLAMTTSGGTVSSGSFGTVPNSGGLVMSIVDLTANTVESSPLISAGPSNTTAYEGRSVSLSVTAVGSGLTYQWRRAGQIIPGATAATLALTNVQASDAGSYVVVVSNDFGSMSSSPAAVTVQPPPPAPVITTQPTAQQAFVGGSASFYVSASGTLLTYQWRKAGQDIAGATSSSLYRSPVTAPDYGDYDVVVSNPGGSVTSNTATLSVPTAPVVLTPPLSKTVSPGSYISLSVGASGVGLTYQWRKDGVPLVGRTTNLLTLGPLTGADYGSYDCVVENPAGSVTSAAAIVAGVPGVRLTNLSVRTNLKAGQTMIIGFVTNSGSKDVLVRAAGPYLDSLQIGLHGLPDPHLTVYDGANLVRQNEDWADTLLPVFAQVGAGAFQSASKDAALLLSITSGSIATRTVHVSGPGEGTILVEAYDATADAGTRLVNVSARNRVGTGDDVLIAGFVIAGGGTKQVLIRGLGPALRKFDITDALADPILTVYSGSDAVAQNDDWTGSLAAVFSQVGASALDAGSADAALLLTLPSGVYTAHLRGKNDTTGEGLIEVYEVN